MKLKGGNWCVDWVQHAAVSVRATIDFISDVGTGKRIYQIDLEIWSFDSSVFRILRDMTPVSLTMKTLVNVHTGDCVELGKQKGLPEQLALTQCEGTPICLLLEHSILYDCDKRVEDVSS